MAMAASKRLRGNRGILYAIFSLQQKAKKPAMRWTDIAHSLGYHDQMHVVHDFNRLSGGSPTAICG